MRPDSFAEQQIKYAKIELDRQIEIGERLTEGMQSSTFLCPCCVVLGLTS